MCMNEIANSLPSLRYPVRSMTQLNMTVWSMVIDCPAVTAKAQEGQFVHLLPDGNYVLRRPISICEIDRKAGTLRLVFEVRGEAQRRSRKSEQEIRSICLAPWGTALLCLRPLPPL